jgi:hypothetical protein
LALRAANSGSGNLAATQRIQAATMALAERFGQPEPQARAYLGAGIAALMAGEGRSSLEWLEKAQAILRESCTGVTYEIHTAQFFEFMARIVLGQIRQAAHRYPEMLGEAEDLGDVLMVANLRILGWNLHVAKDDPELAESEMTEALDGWPATGFLSQHFYRMVGQAKVRLYKGRPRAALELVESQWPALKSSLLLRSQGVRIACLDTRARCLLSTAAAEPANRASLLKAARRDIRALSREVSSNAKAHALKNEGMALALEGHLDHAVANLMEAELAFRQEGMTTDVETVRWMRGHLLGNDQGEELKAAAATVLLEAGYLNPEATARMFVPGLA